MDKIKALIADDHPLFRNALKQALSDLLGDGLLESADFHSTIKQLNLHDDIDLLFLDLKMPGNSGLAGLSQIRAEFPNILIVVVSAEETPSLIVKALQLGASAFIPKSTSLELINEAVSDVLNGNEWLPENLTHLGEHASIDGNDALQRIEQLTPHQLKVLRMMADGLLNKQIAYELDISESTVKQHASACLRKLNVNNRTQAGVIFKQLMSFE
ncbi:MAG: DNA-binding NarL/FixJ family response regulator [Bermanella sp.]|jgi:DNA-binding NarL/FixJ family response regulator|uniref:Nitrate/nitrite response regulator protein homolog n=1 Tax=Brumicola pallidula DSM 14239 = ACAM 615 TaxID=1121922 RepID=K6ZYK0_9ALTE|nr:MULTISPECIES: response regulator transcription factor [Glaciecola]PKH99922.1 DNA-binding response regulator [Glaciecola sp. 33A]GAC28370.1 nitrate/nitrite response regulator protein homolog [Glaciecola pallidula DSM 14239 = ACAM 615]